MTYFGPVNTSLNVLMLTLMVMIILKLYRLNKREKKQQWDTQYRTVLENCGFGESCETNSECHCGGTCIDGACLPPSETNTCNPHTGYLVLSSDKKDFKCLCKYPHLTSGPDCDTVTACGEHGVLLPSTRPVDFDIFTEGSCDCNISSLIGSHDPLFGPFCKPRLER